MYVYKDIYIYISIWLSQRQVWAEIVRDTHL